MLLSFLGGGVVPGDSLGVPLAGPHVAFVVLIVDGLQGRLILVPVLAMGDRPPVKDLQPAEVQLNVLLEPCRPTHIVVLESQSRQPQAADAVQTLQRADFIVVQIQRLDCLQP